MQLLDNYLDLEKQIYEYFGFTETWQVLPIQDCRKYYWRINYSRDGVDFADSEKELAEETGNYYKNSFFYSPGEDMPVYPGKGYALIMVDTHTDGNKFMSIFDKSKCRPDFPRR